MTTIAAPRPVETEANPRAVMGGNHPPLDEMIVAEFLEGLGSKEGFMERLDKLAEKGADPSDCTNDDMAGKYGDFIKMCGAATKAIEAERENHNRPILIAQRSLKARADALAHPVQIASDRVRGKLNAYLAEQEAKRRAEAARIAEENRKAEAARQAQIEEANRKAAEAAEAERQRLQSIEDEKALAAGREAEKVEVEPEPVVVPEPEPVFVAAAPAKAPLRGDYGTAVSTVETWDVKVENIRQVPDAYLKHPTVIEALEKVIRPLVRGKTGLREIKGCKITSSLGSAVR